jgi:hypothetical protein
LCWLGVWFVGIGDGFELGESRGCPGSKELAMDGVVGKPLARCMIAE